VSAASHAAPPTTPRPAGTLPSWWPLAALTLLAAALRLSTLDLQSFWYDEAFTPVHVLHASLSATLRGVVHTENSPPLWYLIEWADSRVLGDGEVALRLPSALAGTATVPVAWMIGRELAGRRAAILAAALVACNPLFVWYSQEARVYALFVLMAALAMMFFARAERDPTRANLAAFSLSASLALLTHYFAVFLLIPMALWLLLAPHRRGSGDRRAVLAALAAPTVVGLALLPLISAQGGHGTQWIGRWPLAHRLEAIPQYYLTGYSGAPLGHGVELLVALAIGAGLALGLWRLSGAPAAPVAGTLRTAGGNAEPRRSQVEHGALLALLLAASGILAPVVLAAFGADYLAPRNLVAAMVPLTALIAVILAAPASGRSGAALGACIALAFLALSLDVNFSPRLQRGNWREVAHVLRGGAPDRAITTVQLGSAPLEYYVHGLRNLPRGRTVTVSEIDETGYAPLRASAGRAPAPGFHLLERRNVDGLIVYRFVSSIPRTVAEATLRRHVITNAHPEVLVPAGL
jgi:4-amino-4-deoxy-L-arabinose transferase-like glycosyltransferase